MTTTTLPTTGVHVEDTGSGPTILCLHGIGSSSASFAPQVAALAGEFRLLAWDAPGYARSADPETDLDLDGFADAAAAVIEAYAAAGPVHVLGVSWGGVIAVRLASRHPELVRSLVLADASRGSGTSAEKAAAMRTRAAELDAAGSAAFADGRGPRLVSPDAPGELVDRVVATMRARIGTSRDPPSRTTVRSCSTRRSFACISHGMSPISSSSTVPSPASSSLPTMPPDRAPVNAPRS